jgi:hypothetical protein
MNVANARMAILIFLFQKGALDRVAIIGGTSASDYTTNMPTRPLSSAAFDIAVIRIALCRMSSCRNKILLAALPALTAVHVAAPAPVLPD